MAPNVLITTGDSRVGYYTAIEMLREKLYNKVVVGMRYNQHGKDLENLGAIVVEIKPEHPDTIEAAIRDNMIGHILIIPPASGNRYMDTKTYIDIAGNIGMRAVVLMSVVNCDVVSAEANDGGEGRRNGDSLREFAKCENYLTKALKNNWCIMRQSFHQQNLLVLADVIQNRGVIPLPIDDGKTGMVNLKDCAIAASAVLQNDHMNKDHQRAVFSITGPYSIDGPALADIAGRVLGYRMRFENIDVKEMQRILESISGLNEHDIIFLIDYFWAVRTGKMNISTNDYKALTGMDGEKIEEFFRENGDQFRHGQGPMEKNIDSNELSQGEFIDEKRCKESDTLVRNCSLM